jgi:hypothetical protein
MLACVGDGPGIQSQRPAAFCDWIPGPSFREEMCNSDDAALWSRQLCDQNSHWGGDRMCVCIVYNLPPHNCGKYARLWPSLLTHIVNLLNDC